MPEPGADNCIACTKCQGLEERHGCSGWRGPGRCRCPDGLHRVETGKRCASCPKGQFAPAPVPAADANANAEADTDTDAGADEDTDVLGCLSCVKCRSGEYRRGCNPSKGLVGKCHRCADLTCPDGHMFRLGCGAAPGSAEAAASTSASASASAAAAAARLANDATSVSRGHCYCKEGMYRAGDACLDCPSGKYRARGTPTLCPGGTCASASAWPATRQGFRPRSSAPCARPTAARARLRRRARPGTCHAPGWYVHGGQALRLSPRGEVQGGRRWPVLACTKCGAHRDCRLPRRKGIYDPSGNGSDNGQQRRRSDQGPGHVPAGARPADTERTSAPRRPAPRVRPASISRGGRRAATTAPVATSSTTLARRAASRAPGAFQLGQRARPLGDKATCLKCAMGDTSGG